MGSPETELLVSNDDDGANNTELIETNGICLLRLLAKDDQVLAAVLDFNWGSAEVEPEPDKAPPTADHEVLTVFLVHTGAKPWLPDGLHTVDEAAKSWSDEEQSTATAPETALLVATEGLLLKMLSKNSVSMESVIGVDGWIAAVDDTAAPDEAEVPNVDEVVLMTSVVDTAAEL